MICPDCGIEEKFPHITSADCMAAMTGHISEMKKAIGSYVVASLRSNRNQDEIDKAVKKLARFVIDPPV